MKFTTRVKEWLRRPREFKFNPWLHGWPRDIRYTMEDYPVDMIGRRFRQNGSVYEIMSFASTTKDGASPDDGVVTCREVK